MSFVLNQKLDTTLTYAGVVSGVPAAAADVNVTYEIISVSVNSSSATAKYITSINGASSDLLKFHFVYSGSGNPIDEAEEKLKEYLQDAS
ncbi:hypothetical protein VSX61_14925 [Brenneria populi subsp. brevivirga]|uniref:hypothetical protein n=1 Tax=Brenneria populi TaxID=1505588 RepID=UPI002E17C68F|nr:hypothetical protein [Brenneria populi subsp. brevivirga]